MRHQGSYDVIIIGGGLGGAALGKSLAEKGIQVLVLEREATFSDRVRGEYVHPWGVTEVRTLGLYEQLKQTCGYEVRFRVSRISGVPPAPPRDLVATSPHRVGSLHFYHPQMQEVVLEAAIQAGASVQRGVKVVEVSPGPTPRVRVQADQNEHTYQARLVVGADGRRQCHQPRRAPRHGRATADL
jgi:2-polyprenyl-6-methoxyphenol hydroxylase-like FAD-dependent oxidoreductase